MLARFHHTLMSLAAAALTASSASAQHFPSNDSLTALIKLRVGTTGVGMVLGVMEADGTTRIVSHGTAGLDAKPLGPKSVFELGSITKVFTGILLADLVERKQVSLSDPVARYLPKGNKMPSRGGREITLLDLATHRSSLTRMPTNMKADGVNPYPKYSIPELYAFLNEHELRRDIGSEYEYSNIAVALLGHVIERVAGKPYEQLVQERIVKPLGMSVTSTKVTGPLKEWMTIGHDDRGLVAAYRGWEELPAMGALRSNAEDMLKFLAANTGPATNRLERAMRASHAVHSSVNPNVDMSLNWQITKFGAQRIIHHGGATQGFRAFVGFDPDARVGVVLLANYPAQGVDIAMHLLNPKVPLSGAAVAERVQIDLPEDVLKQYVGDYELRPTFSVNVTLENGALFSQATGQRKLPIFPESQSRFFMRDVNAQITFTRDPSGAVTGGILHQGGRDQPVRRRVAPGVPLASAEEMAAAVPGRKTTIPSRLLGGDRAVRIVTPRGYELTQSVRYPVLYVLDTERPLHAASSVTGALAQSQTVPDMIVVHVTGIPAAAERSAFAKFLADELQPWVAREYRTENFSVLVGSADVLAATTGFQAKIATRSDLSARASFRDQQQPATPATDPHAALGESLKWLFGGWDLPNLPTLATQLDTGWKAIDAHYASLSQRFGFKAIPPENVVDRAALSLAPQRRFEDALKILQKNRELHPGSAVVWNHLGDVYRILCRRAESKEHYTKAYELAQAMKYANVSNYQMELNRITQEIETNAPCTPPGATRPSIAVAEPVLRTYVGEYALSARVSIVVTLDGGTLYGQPTGEPSRPIRALSETRFFVENSSIELTFTKDAAGAVTGIIMHQGGRDAPGRKVK